MKLTKTFVRYAGSGGGFFWIDPMACFQTDGCFMVKVFENTDLSLKTPILLNLNNVIYIKWFEDETREI